MAARPPELAHPRSSPATVLSMISRNSLLAAGVLAAALVPVSAASAAKVAPDVTKLKVTPVKFKALATGNSVVLSGGALVTFNIIDGAYVDFAVKAEKPGKRVGGKCVVGKAKTKKGACVRTVAVPGGFKLIGISGDNEFNFSGRIGDKTLAPGSYRLIAKAEGTAARSSYARFKITK
jgi:hypothetical protein